MAKKVNKRIFAKKARTNRKGLEKYKKNYRLLIIFIPLFIFGVFFIFSNLHARSYNELYPQFVASSSPTPTDMPVPTADPTLDVFQILPQVQGHCVEGTYFADTNAFSFCYPSGWSAKYYPNRSKNEIAEHIANGVVLSNGAESIGISENPVAEVPIGAEPTESRGLVIDGHDAAERIYKGQMGVFIFNKTHVPTVESKYDVYGYYITYNSPTGIVRDEIKTIITLLEKTFTIKQWDNP